MKDTPQMPSVLDDHEKPVPKTGLHVLITGTTSGIGQGLVQHYSALGVSVTAVNRRKDAELEARYPAVRFEHIDVQDTQAVKNLIVGLARADNMPDVLILNAGINRVDNDIEFDLAQFNEILAINLLGVMNFVAPITALRIWPKKIRITVVSSSTNYVANPYCLGYYISKKAVTQSFQVLFEMYKKTNLQFKWVVLGPVPTPIDSSSDKFPKIMVRVKQMFSASVHATVLSIAKFAASDRHRLIFPLRSFVLFQGMRLGQCILPGFFRGRKSLSGRQRGK